MRFFATVLHRPFRSTTCSTPIGVVAAKPTRREPEGDAGRVLAVLRDAPATADEVSRVLELPAAEVAALLIELELDGLVEPGDGAYRATIAA